MFARRVSLLIAAGVLSSGFHIFARDPKANDAITQGQAALRTNHLDEAQKWFEQACGAADPVTEPMDWRALCLHSYASVAFQRGQFREGEGLYLKAREMWEKGPVPHPLALAITLSNLGEIYEQEARWKDAVPVFQQVLALETPLFPAEHVRIAGSMRRMAGAYIGVGELDRAAPLLQKAIRIQRQALPNEASELVLSLNAQAVLDVCKGRYQAAEGVLLDALEITRKTSGENDPDFAASLGNLAGVYLMRRDYVRAGPPLARAIRIYEVALGSDHPRLAALLVYDATVKAADRKFSAAEAEAKRAIAMLEKSYDSDHITIAVANANLAEIYLQEGKTARAEEILPGALAIERSYLNRRDSRLATTIRDMGELRMQQHRFQESEAFYREAMQMFELTADRAEAARVLTEYTLALKRAGKSKAEVKSAEERLKGSAAAFGS